MIRTHRYAIAALALSASTILISCSSDDNGTPSDNSGAPIVADSTISGSLPTADTNQVVESTLP